MWLARQGCGGSLVHYDETIGEKKETLLKWSFQHNARVGVKFRVDRAVTAPLVMSVAGGAGP